MPQFNISVQLESDVPKYRQIIESVLRGIQSGSLRKGDLLPSINEVSKDYSLARETVVKAYNDLKEKGLVGSRPGKGFFVSTSHYASEANIFVLFDVLLTPYKETLYNGIREGLKEKAHLDFYFHHHNPELFCKLLNDARGKYEYYVVMPFPDDSVREALSTFEQDKLLLLDIDIDYPEKTCAVIRQNHEQELARALETGLDSIRRYEAITFVFPDDKNHPVVNKDAFNRFCRRHKITHRIVPHLKEKAMHPGQVYFLIEDEDLVNLVKFMRANKLKAGRDIGIISYNDTPFKEIIEGGITVVSVDFHEMGLKAAEQILCRDEVNTLQPTDLVKRGSL